MALEKLLPREIPPPISDGWRPGHSRNHKKKFGLVTFIQMGRYWYTRNGSEFWEHTQWYETKRDRDNAIVNANKPRKWSPVAAMQKVER